MQARLQTHFPRLTGGEIGRVLLQGWAEALRGAPTWLRSRSKLVVEPRLCFPAQSTFWAEKKLPLSSQACMYPLQEIPTQRGLHQPLVRALDQYKGKIRN